MIENPVVIIILNHNKKYDVLECLESVFSQNYKNYRVILVDNGSTDNTVEAVHSKYPSVHLVENKINTGAGPGRNMGWQYAEKNFDYKYLLFLDDDTIVDKNYLKKLAVLFKNNTRAGIVCGKAYTDKKKNIIMSAGIRANLFSGSIYDRGSGKKDNGQYDNSGYVDACGCFGIMVRRELFAAIKGFDSNYAPYGWEDVDLCLKARKLGYYTYYLSDAVIIHKGTKLGRKPNPLYEKSKIKNYFYLFKNNASVIQKISCILCSPFQASRLIIKSAFNGNAGIIKEHFKGFFDGISNIKLINKTNK